PRLSPRRVRRLRAAAGVPAARRPRHARRRGPGEPRQPVGVRAAHGGREERLRPHPRRPRRRARPRADRRRLRRPGGGGHGRPRPRGLRPRRGPRRPLGGPAVLRAGVRGGGPRARGRAGRRVPRRGRPPLPRRPRVPLRLLLPRRPAPPRRVGQPARLRHRPDRPAPPAGAPAGGRRPVARPHRHAARLLRRLGGHARLPAGEARPRRRDRGPRRHRGVRLDDPAAPGLHRGTRPPRQPRHHREHPRVGRLRAAERSEAMETAMKTVTDPILLEIVEGTLASVEREVETAIARTARSPMIRDAHDFRAGIHDRRLRKLTGRSYSALVHPVVRDFPLETMRPGDVFFHNDVYLSEGGIGHLPDLCVTVPVFHGGEVVAFVQAFGHHDDIGGAVPGSMPSHARSAFEEGLMVPPIKLWDRGVPNEAALTIMTRNSRMPDSLAGDLDAECSACLMGARRLGELFDRYGRADVEACFDAIIDNTTETFRRELLSKAPAGTGAREDYAEHDGVDPPRLHAQRITLTVDKSADVPLVIDFAGTSPQAKGPINHAGDYAD